MSIAAAGLTALTLKTAMTLSSSLPLFTCSPSSEARDLARHSMRSATSAAECVLPLIPHVNGDRDDARGNRPYLSTLPKRNS